MPAGFFPAYVVWELTLRCDQRCAHCGSRAGPARAEELTTAEALGVVEQLAAMKAREVVLIGGEAYLHLGFLEIVRALRAAGILPSMTTGGRAVTPELAARMKEAGIGSVSVSVDGLEPAHDALRGPGSFAAATAALGYLRAAGIVTASNLQLNRVNQADLEPLYEHLRGVRVSAWQVQLTAPLGRAADAPERLLQPWELVELLPRIARLKERAFDDGILLMPGNNLGYFGPNEALLRSPERGGRAHYQGCVAGKFSLGIESDGAVKGCPSLQTAHYVGGNVRTAPLQSIWDSAPELSFARKRTVDDLWGFCRTCAYAPVCLGGCTFTAHSILGRPGNNPYCYHRALTLARQGRRERLVPVERAPGLPFDNGRLEIVEEALEGTG